MTQTFKNFCKSIGLDHSKIAPMLEENYEGDEKEIASEYLEIRKKLIEQELKPDLEKAINKVAFGKSTIKAMRDYNKALGLGFSSDDIKEMKFEDFVEAAKKAFETKGETTDSEYKQKYDDLLESMQSSKNEFESQINALKSEHETALNSERQKNQDFIGKLNFSKAVAKKELGVSKEHLDIFKKHWYSEITSKYNIQEDGAITDKDGNKAINFEGNGHYLKIDEALDYLIDRDKAGKKSRGSEDVDDKNFSDNQSEEYNDLRSRMIAKSN